MNKCKPRGAEIKLGRPPKKHLYVNTDLPETETETETQSEWTQRYFFYAVEKDVHFKTIKKENKKIRPYNSRE